MIIKKKEKIIGKVNNGIAELKEAFKKEKTKNSVSKTTIIKLMEVTDNIEKDTE